MNDIDDGKAQDEEHVDPDTIIGEGEAEPEAEAEADDETEGDAPDPDAAA